MKKQFLKMFLLILGISLCVLMIQGASLLFANHRAVARWPRFVTSEYLETVVNQVDAQEFSSSASLINAILEKVPDAISGLLIRDGSGNYSFMYGSSTRGSDQDKKALRFVNSEGGGEVSLLFTLTNNMLVEDNVFDKKVSVFTLNVDSGFDGLSVSYTDQGKETLHFVTPGFLNREDVAGRVYINNNGVISGSFDVIIYDINNFGPTWMLLREVFLSFLIFIPIGLLVSITASYKISKTATKNTAIIKESLSKLSNGDYDFTIENFKNEEYNKIARSIEALKVAMEQSEKSRHEWLLSISHDLNTPVTSLIMLYEGLKDQIFTLDQTTLDSIYKELKALKDRISAVSYYTNLRLAGGPDSLLELNLESYINDIIISFPALDVTLESSLDYTIKGDSSLINRALFEAFKNCNEYSTDKKVFVEARKADDGIYLRIKNRGQICEQNDYFELWTRGDASRTRGGSGLGLPTIKRIMELNRGDISFYQEEEFVILEFRFEEFL